MFQQQINEIGADLQASVFPHPRRPFVKRAVPIPAYTFSLRTAPVAFDRLFFRRCG